MMETKMVSQPPLVTILCWQSSQYAVRKHKPALNRMGVEVTLGLHDKDPFFCEVTWVPDNVGRKQFL